MPELKYDPAKVNARIAEVEADIAIHEGRASWLRDLADDEEREVMRYEGRVEALKKLLTAEAANPITATPEEN